MNWADVAVSIAQVAAGGGIIQGIVAYTKRRSAMRQLDRDSDSRAVKTADSVIEMLHEELDMMRIERDELRKQVRRLGNQVTRCEANLAIARAEIARLTR